jgi:hypothetical protein
LNTLSSLAAAAAGLFVAVVVVLVDLEPAQVYL